MLFIYTLYISVLIIILYLSLLSIQFYTACQPFNTLYCTYYLLSNNYSNNHTTYHWLQNTCLERLFNTHCYYKHTYKHTLSHNVIYISCRLGSDLLTDISAEANLNRNSKSKSNLTLAKKNTKRTENKQAGAELCQAKLWCRQIPG